MRPVVDAGEHDQGGDRAQVEGERQQHRHGRQRAESGQHPDQGADQNADEAIDQVHQGEGDPQAESDVAEQLHEAVLIGERPDRDLQPEAVNEHKERPHGQNGRQKQNPAVSEFAPAQRGKNDKGEDGDHQAKAFQGETEQNDAGKTRISGLK